MEFENHLQAVAAKLHGVEVDIKIIKRKGDPITENDIGVKHSNSPKNIKDENNGYYDDRSSGGVADNEGDEYDEDFYELNGEKSRYSSDLSKYK